MNTILKLTDLLQIENVIKTLRSELQSYNVPQETFFDIQLAITEAVNNAFIHGSKGLKKLLVEIEWWITSDKIQIKIKDNGPGFDYSQAGRFNVENILDEKGKGLFLMFSVLDKVWFNDQGNEVYCLKKW